MYHISDQTPTLLRSNSDQTPTYLCFRRISDLRRTSDVFRQTPMNYPLLVTSGHVTTTSDTLRRTPMCSDASDVSHDSTNHERSRNILQVHYSLYDHSVNLRPYLWHSLSNPLTTTISKSDSGSYPSQHLHFCGWHRSCGCDKNCGWHNSCGCITVADTPTPLRSWL